MRTHANLCRSWSSTAASYARGVLPPLPPLSPLSASFRTTALLGLEPEQRNRILYSGRKVEKILGASPSVEVTPPSPSTVLSPLPTSLQTETSIMERLQGALASPFSPKTFVRSMTVPSPATTAAPKYGPRPMGPPIMHFKVLPAHESHNRTVTGLKPRRKRPAALPLAQTSRLPETSPMSPLRYGVLAPRPAKTPVSPTTLLDRLSPVTHITDKEVERQKMEKLARYLGESVPDELVYPSFGQIGEQADKVGSFLDLYRSHASAATTEKDTGAQQPSLQEIIDAERSAEDLMRGSQVGGSSNRRTRSNTLRRSRSMGDFYTSAELLQTHRPYITSTQTRDDTSIQSQPANDEAIIRAHPSAIIEPVMVNDDPVRLQRKRSVANIIVDDAKHMTEYRLGFRSKPMELTLAPLPPPTGPLPPPPVSTSPLPSMQDLKSAKTPRGPYWVKPTQVSDPKTPRTVRTERRQGWGGAWNFWSMRESTDRSLAL
ncbi:hypothetical protein ABKN59_004948 [Abortiporus biennis]